MEEKFVRKYKEDRPVVAICYDFDKTLSPENMQEQGYIQSVGEDIEEFWKWSNVIAEENEMDQNLAYMYTMAKKSEGKHIFNKKLLSDYGSKVRLFKGVEDWFERINKYGKDRGVIVEHYIISSGLKEMIEGTKVARYFTKIYASSFYYDESGLAVWPAQAVNYTNKTQFLFRIEKGILDVNDQGVNDHFDSDELRVPFRNIVYIGDSDTDIPCMKLVNTFGGHSIGVYDPDTKDKSKVYRMMKDKRIKFFAAADYSFDSELDKLVKGIIDRTVFNEKLEDAHSKYFREMELEDRNNIDAKKDELISKLESSKNFRTTHEIINELKNYENWSVSQKHKLIEIFINNNQVKWISEDEDVCSFYKSLLSSMDEDDCLLKEIKNIDENCNFEGKIELLKLKEILRD